MYLRFWCKSPIFSIPTGGGIFGLLSKKSRFGRNPIVMLGIAVHFIAFYLIFVNMPSNAPVAPMEGTDDIAYMIPRYVSSSLWLV